MHVRDQPRQMIAAGAMRAKQPEIQKRFTHRKFTLWCTLVHGPMAAVRGKSKRESKSVVACLVIAAAGWLGAAIAARWQRGMLVAYLISSFACAAALPGQRHALLAARVSRTAASRETVRVPPRPRP